MGARSSDSRRFPRGKCDAAQRSPATRSRCSSTFEVVLMEGRRKNGTAERKGGGRGRRNFSVSGSVDRSAESRRIRLSAMIWGARREGRPRGFTSAYFRGIFVHVYVHTPRPRRTCRETRSKGVYVRASLRAAVRRNISE